MRAKNLELFYVARPEFDKFNLFLFIFSST
jgi:hypothetical protein